MQFTVASQCTLKFHFNLKKIEIDFRLYTNRQPHRRSPTHTLCIAALSSPTTETSPQNDDDVAKGVNVPSPAHISYLSQLLFQRFVPFS